MTDSNIPVIGQPTVTDWFIALQVKCPCGRQFQLVGQVGGMRACDGKEIDGQPCRKVYRISGLPVLQAGASSVLGGPPVPVPGIAPIVVSLDGSLFEAGIAYGSMPTT